MVCLNQHKLRGLSFLPELGFFKLITYFPSKMLSLRTFRGYWLLLLVLKNHYEDTPFNELAEQRENTPKPEISKNT